MTTTRHRKDDAAFLTHLTAMTVPASEIRAGDVLWADEPGRTATIHSVENWGGAFVAITALVWGRPFAPSPPVPFTFAVTESIPIRRYVRDHAAK